MNRQSLRDRIVQNVRKLNAAVKAPQSEAPRSAPSTVTLFAG